MQPSCKGRVNKQQEAFQDLCESLCSQKHLQRGIGGAGVLSQAWSGAWLARAWQHPSEHLQGPAGPRPHSQTGQSWIRTAPPPWSAKCVISLGNPSLLFACFYATLGCLCLLLLYMGTAVTVLLAQSYSAITSAATSGSPFCMNRGILHALCSSALLSFMQTNRIARQLFVT